MKCWQFSWSSFGSITELFSAFPSCRIWCCRGSCRLLGCYCVAQQKFNDISQQSTASLFRVEKQWLSVWKAYRKYLSNVHIQCSAHSVMWLMPAKCRIHTLLLVSLKSSDFLKIWQMVLKYRSCSFEVTLAEMPFIQNLWEALQGILCTVLRPMFQSVDNKQYLHISATTTGLKSKHSIILCKQRHYKFGLSILTPHLIL